MSKKIHVPCCVCGGESAYTEYRGKEQRKLCQPCVDAAVEAARIVKAAGR